MNLNRENALPSLVAFYVLAETFIGPQTHSDVFAIEMAAKLTISAFTLTQATLLGMWIGMGNARFGVRLFGGLLAVLGLAVVAKNMGDLDAAGWFLAPTAGVIAITLWGARAAGYRLTNLSHASSLTNYGDRQFQIRHVLVLTVFSAVVIAVAKSIGIPTDVVQAVVVVNLAFTIVGLAALWAILTNGSPSVRIPIVFGGACLIGWAASFAIDSWLLSNAQVVVPVFMFAFVLTLSLNLLVFRWCGFRILRRDGNLSANAP